MFTINYEFQDGGPLYKCTFPKKEHSDHNLFFIRGTNDQGKTTTLNMVALGLYANESTIAEKGIISDSLRAKMEYLCSDKLDVLKFDFIIKSKDGLMEIYSQYDKGSLNTKLNGEPVGSEYFNENIQVLYDVPDDPLVKLQSSVRLIRENLIDYERYLTRYDQDLGNKRTQIIDFKEKDKKIQKNKGILEETKRELENKKELKNRVEAEVSKLEIADKVISYYEIEDLYEQNENELVSLKEKRTNLKQKGLGGGTPKFKQQVTEFNIVNSNTKKSLSLIKKYREILSEENLTFIKKIEKKLNELYSPKEIAIKNIEEWTDDVKKIILDLKNDPLNEKFKQEEKQSELINKIMEVLRGYLSLEMNVPGTDEKNIFSFYKELDEFNKQLEPKILKKRDLAEVSSELNKLSVYLSDLKVKRDKIPDVDEEQMYEYDQIEKEIKKLESKLDLLEKESSKHEEIVESLSENEIDEILDNPGQREQYKRTKKEFEDLEIEIASLGQKEKTLVALIEQLGELETLPAFDEDWLEEESAKCFDLISKVNKWKKALEPVDFRKTDMGIDYKHAKELFDALSEYFAEILQNVYFEKKSWVVEKVDLVNRQYIVKNRKPIKFVQMGTGHTALNSILSRIKQNFGGKKKIILVDEIGHMDEKNIGILVDEIKSQIKKGETIFALITIADSKVSEITWDPVPV
jgi:hypothetical protein